MKRQRSMLERLAGTDLAGEPLPGVPLVEIAGERRVLIENHQGVTAYCREQIQIRVGFGELCVCGAGLELMQMTGQQLVICGRIDSVNLIRRER